MIIYLCYFKKLLGTIFKYRIIKNRVRMFMAYTIESKEYLTKKFSQHEEKIYLYVSL